MRIEAHGVAAGYGRAEVIRGIDLCIDQGELVGVIGPNGAGKSTLLRALSRAIPLVSGELVYDGQPADSFRAIDLARRIAFVPQNEISVFDFRVVDVVLMGRHPHVSALAGESAADFAEAARAMAAVDVLHLAERPVTQLSGGEHRRVLIARALAQRAQTLFLDEPTAHLDLGHQREVLTVVRRQVDDAGISCLAALHDLNLAAAYCDRLVLISGGRIHSQGSIADVLRGEVLSPAFGAELEVLSMNGRIVVLPMPPDLSPDTHTSVKVHVVCGGGSGTEILCMLHRQGHTVTAGALNQTDTDQLTCAALDIEHVCETPYSALSAESIAACSALMANADAIIVTAVPFGPGNIGNLELVINCQANGKRIILLDASYVTSRDYTEGRASQLFQTLIDNGALCADSVHGLPTLILDNLSQMGSSTR